MPHIYNYIYIYIYGFSNNFVVFLKIFQFCKDFLSTCINITQDDDSGHRILQEPAGNCGKNHRILNEKSEKSLEDRSSILARKFSGDFSPFLAFSIRKRSEVTGKNPKISGQEYCFLEIPGSSRHRSFSFRILRPGLSILTINSLRTLKNSFEKVDFREKLDLCIS